MCLFNSPRLAKCLHRWLAAWVRACACGLRTHACRAPCARAVCARMHAKPGACMRGASPPPTAATSPCPCCKWISTWRERGDSATCANSTVGPVFVLTPLINLLNLVVETVGVPLLNRRLAQGLPIPSSPQVCPSNSQVAIRHEFLVVATDIELAPQ